MYRDSGGGWVGFGRPNFGIRIPCLFVACMSKAASTEAIAKKPAGLAGRASGWGHVLILAVPIAWLYGPIFLGLVLQWSSDSNFAHGFFVLPFSLFVVWRNRVRLRTISCRPSPWGLPIVAFALSLLIIGDLGAVLFVSRVSLLFLVAGLVVVFFGWNHLRATLFPIAFLLLMIPIPAIVFGPLTMPLQILGSKIAASALPIFGVPVFREGNIINLPTMSLEVAQACSGVRSLLSLVTLVAIHGYLIKSPTLMRIALVLAAIPITILVNSLRIIGTGLLVEYWGPSKASGFFHTFSGWLLFLLTLQMMLLLHQVLASKSRGVCHAL